MNSLLLNICRTLMAARAFAWLRANAAALGVGTPFVGVVFSYAWNATETSRMARKIRNGYFSPEAPADYQNRFCLFPWHMMETAKMVGLVGLKSSTMCYFLRERPNPFYLKLTEGNVYDAMLARMKDSVYVLPFFADHLRWDPRKSNETKVIEVFKMVREQTGSVVQWEWMWSCPPRQCPYQRLSRQSWRKWWWERKAQPQSPQGSMSISWSRTSSGSALMQGWLAQS